MKTQTQINNDALTQDWATSKNTPTYEKNGTWENWMSFGGISCSEAFDAGYDGLPLGKFAGHPALIAAHESGGCQRIEGE